MARRRLRGTSRGLRWGQVGGRELASPAAAVAGPSAPGGGEEAGAAACSGNVPGRRRGWVDGLRTGARGPPAGVAGPGAPGRARGRLGGPGPRGDEKASRRGVGGRAWRSLRRAAGLGGIGHVAVTGPRRRPDVPCSRAPRDPPAGFAPEAPDLGQCNLLGRRGSGERCGVLEGSLALPGYKPVSPEIYLFSGFSWEQGKPGAPFPLTPDTGGGAESCR